MLALQRQIPNAPVFQETNRERQRRNTAAMILMTIIPSRVAVSAFDVKRGSLIVHS